MSVFGRYLAGRFLAFFVFTLGALSALALTLDLMEEADRVLSSSHGGIGGLLWYTALRLPDIVAQMLPIAALLAIVLMLGRLLRHSELVAMWGSGVSPWQLIARLLPIMGGLAVFAFVNADIAVPETRTALRAWGVGEARKTGILDDDGSKAWMRSGQDIVRTPKQASAAGELLHVTIFRRDGEGRLLEQLDAARAVPEDHGWLLLDVARTDVATAATTSQDSQFWDGRIDIAALPLLVSDIRDLRSGQLLALIRNQGYGQRPTYRFATWLQWRMSAAAVPALMLLLAIALAQRFRRTGVFATLLLAALGIGFAFLALDGIALAMGEAGLLPPWFAAWGPKLALAGVIGTLLVGREA
jgi:lipopolysaccharide export system permease protein